MQRRLLLVLPITLLILVLTFSSATAQADPIPSSPAAGAAAGTTFTYQGRLSDGGSPVNGTCDFNFGLFDAATDGTQIGFTESVAGVGVTDGLFMVPLDFGAEAFSGTPRWLEIEVRCPAGSGLYTPLTPRQEVYPVPTAMSLVPGAVISGTAETALYVENRTQTGWGGGIFARVHSPDEGTSALFGKSDAETGWSHGLTGGTNSRDGSGVVGYNNATDGGYGVWGEAKATSGWGVGVHGQTSSPDSTGVSGASLATSGWSRGVTGITKSPEGVGVVGLGEEGGIGLYGSSTTGVALYLKSDSGPLIHGVGAGDTDIEFEVTNTGDVYADGSYNTPAADFAEMMPAAADLVPGEVLVIGADGELARSTEPGQTNVAGVYATDPGFVGGAGEAVEGEIPLTIIGIVPVKASTENGAIAPGDLLMTAETDGHAMLADPVEVDGVTFFPSGLVLGKALEPLSEGTGVIEMLVTLQ